MKQHDLYIDTEEQGQRLDFALAKLFPEYGLRARRRLWSIYKITVNGKVQKPGYLLQLGEYLRLEPVEPLNRLERDAYKILAEKMYIVAASIKYISLYKPAGLASASIAVNGIFSAEDYVAESFSSLWKLWEGAEKSTLVYPEQVFLCNRLDNETSGLLTFASSLEGVRQFRDIEKNGDCIKTYQALVYGELKEVLYLDAALAMHKTRTTTVLDYADPDPTRHTLLKPLGRYLKLPPAEALPEEQIMSLVQVDIKRGARHQIRVHLAHAGYPIVGDKIYAKKNGVKIDQRLFLHHLAIELPGFKVECTEDWLTEAGII